MSREDAARFLQTERIAVLATVSPDGMPQSALIGIAATPDFELVFDTIKTTRKYRNLAQDPRASLVIGCTESGITLQYEGVARELRGIEMEKYRQIYFAQWPDGTARLSWDGITYFAVRPSWIRYCNYAVEPPVLTEFTFPF
ncbi:MAG TPA: pyridoxamine 5'-phosphate oxidase family protein [Leptospiraceae bacterium]|mgnify:FL=1|nr:pyridoxamine 5'-phosphate oxidase family protein [Leptospiraceae bacterium]HNK99551.1 pyridoxamine 5'-phosphate oxidase family protein [Leptospiraceae bacterium]